MDKIQTDINSLFENNISSLAESFGQALQNALGQYEKLRDTEAGDLISERHPDNESSAHDSEQKGNLSNIYISFLLSSVLCKLPLLRIDLYYLAEILYKCAIRRGRIGGLRPQRFWFWAITK